MNATRQATFRHLCATEPSIPLFSQDWWLDATAGPDNWDAVIVEGGGKVLAAMPYVKRRKLGLFTLMTQPPLTQHLGPWLRPSEAKYAKNLSQQKDLLEALVDGLPAFDHFRQNWHYSQLNWTPFYWRGFKQTTRYTYVLDNLSTENALWDGLQANIRTDIRKASNRLGVRVRDDLSIDDFLELNSQVFARQGLNPPYAEMIVKRLDSACQSRNARKMFIAEDGQGRRHAGVYIVWDANSAYYLMGGGDPELRSSGATSLCMWRAIQFAATVTKKFDFEGSMLEPVERFFRAFGARQTPYFHITKTTSRLLKTYHFLTELKSGK